MLQRLQTKRNLILQGPPGTGKTWLAKKLAYALIGHKDDSKVRPLQFHPNLSYEDFVRGWRPQGDGKLDLADGPFLQLVQDAEQNPDDEYVMVIEEINRGNPAQIFGEMLTLLEADKRNEGEALALAYPRVPGERVHIPPNVYVIGTMNVATARWRWSIWLYAAGSPSLTWNPFSAAFGGIGCRNSLEPMSTFYRTLSVG